jgi:hypothetical protein
MLKATYKSTFPHKGNERHVYVMSGTPEELAEFKANQGGYYTEDTETGVPLFYTNFRSIMDEAVLKFSERSGNYNFDEKELQGAISKVNSIGGAVGQAMAVQLGTALLPDSVRKLMAGAQTTLDFAPAVEEVPENNPDTAGEF